MRVIRCKWRDFCRILVTMALLIVTFGPATVAMGHEFTSSPFVTEARQGRFPFLGIITYHCDRGGREVICSGQGFLVSRCMIMTSDHVSRDPVDQRYSKDRLTKSFRLQGMDYAIIPVDAGLAADGSRMAENNVEDWGLMRIVSNECPGSHYGWVKDPTIDPTRMPIGQDIAVYSVDDPDFSHVTVSRGKFYGKSPGDVLLMTSASMRPGQSGGIVVTSEPDGTEHVIGMVQGANYARYRFYKKGVKAFSSDAANFFTDIFRILSKSPATNLINQDRQP